MPRVPTISLAAIIIIESKLPLSTEVNPSLTLPVGPRVRHLHFSRSFH